MSEKTSDVLNDIGKLRYGALLHDIGKFWQGAGGSGKHEELSVKFVRQYLPKHFEEISFISMHHDSSVIHSPEYRLIKILICADWLSSGERSPQDEERGKRVTTAMQSIFSKLVVAGKSLQESFVLEPNLYSLESSVYPKQIFDAKEDLASLYKSLWNSFCTELDNLEKSDDECFLTSLYYLLLKYTSFIPSAVWKSVPDVSLFDHAKTTCAIAECLYKNADLKQVEQLLTALPKKLHKEKLNDDETLALNNQTFYLIGGDVSGIQKFIYSIVAKRAVKALKGRSLYLEFFTETIANYILKKFDLPVTNLLYCAGGHFYILAPQKINLDEMRKNISTKLLDLHKGKLYVALEAVPLTPQDFLDCFSLKWGELGEMLHRRKKKKFEEVLQKIDFNAQAVEDVCYVCGMPVSDSAELFAEDDVKKCHSCRGFEQLADAVKDKKYVLVMKTTKKKTGWNNAFSLFGCALKFVNEISDTISCETIYRINDTDFVLKNVSSSLGFTFHLSTPRKDLKSLAEAADGVKRWGVMRGDVDNLGKIFSEGLGKHATISRVSTLSGMLSFFFQGRMNALCREYHDTLYGVYSGGDDFFIIGPWNILPEAAQRIYNDFRLFTCHHPAITLSVGISLAPSEKYPVYRIAESAGDELEKAKRIDADKDAISFLGKPVHWADFKGVEDCKNQILRLVKTNKSRGFLHKLSGVYNLYEQHADHVGDIIARYDDRAGRWRWMLAYSLARMKLDTSVKNEFYAVIKNNIRFLDVSVRWADYLTRSDGKYE